MGLFGGFPGDWHLLDHRNPKRFVGGYLCRQFDIHSFGRRWRTCVRHRRVCGRQQFHRDGDSRGARAHVLRRAWGVHGRRAAGTVCLCDLCWRQRVHCGRHTEHIDDGEFPGNQRFHGRRFPGTACVCHVRCHWRFLRGRCAGHSGDGRIFLGIDILDFRQRGPPCRSDLRIRLRL